MLKLLLTLSLVTVIESSYIRSNIHGRKFEPAFMTFERLMTPLDGEPSCEDLRLMWRFSRRQHRVAEVTNEIPTYRDPFAYNIWEALPRPKEIYLSALRSGGRSWNRPIYGRMIQNAPRAHPRFGSIKAYEQLLRYLGNTKKPNELATAFRLTGGIPRASPLTKINSFQHLKKMIWAERAKELQEQKILEEAAARSVALQDLSLSTPEENRGFEYGKPMFEAPLPVGQMRYFEEAPPYRFQPTLPRRKPYRIPVSYMTKTPR